MHTGQTRSERDQRDTLRSQIIFIPIIALVFTISVNAQERKVAQTTPSLFNEIDSKDSIMFSAFNMQNMEIFKPLFTVDLEWY